MKSIFLILIIGFKTFAVPSHDQVLEALARADGVEKHFFELVIMKKTTKGFELKYSRMLGEGGLEKCSAYYRTDGTLKSLNCDLDYISHSMGPENKQFLIQATRFYDKSGKLIKVQGSTREILLRNKKVIENRKIKLVNDEKIERLTKPLLILDLQTVK